MSGRSRFTRIFKACKKCAWVTRNDDELATSDRCGRSPFIPDDCLCASERDESVPGQAVPSCLSSHAMAAHERRQATGVITSSTVGVFSMARRNRNHQVEIIRRKLLAGISAK